MCALVEVTDYNEGTFMYYGLNHAPCKTLKSMSFVAVFVNALDE